MHHGHGLDLTAIKESDLFVPVLPLFEASGRTPLAAGQERNEHEGSGVLKLALANDFLAEQKRTLEARFKELGKVFPADNKLITLPESKLCVLVLHARSVATAHSEAVDYIEDMLRKQLIAAIGKEVRLVSHVRSSELSSGHVMPAQLRSSHASSTHYTTSLVLFIMSHPLLR